MGPEVDVDREAEAEQEVEQEPNLESEVKPKVEPEAEPEIESEPETKPETKPEAEPEQEVEPKLEAEVEVAPEPEPKSEVESEPETEPKSEPELAPKTELEPEHKTSVDTEEEPSSTQQLDTELELLDSDITPYNDFLPTKDTVTVISHLDVDGILCLAAIIKMLNSTKKGEPKAEEDMWVRVFFTSPSKVFSTLAKSIPDLNKIQDDEFQIGNLYICDLSIDRDTVLGAAVYNNMKWFDHHEVYNTEQLELELENSELIIDTLANSATSIICNYFKIEDELSIIADEVDTNQIESENAKRICEIIGALKLKYTGTRLKRLLYDFAYKLAKDIFVINEEKYNKIIEEYNKWLDEYNNYAKEKIQISIIKEHKVGIIETENIAPVYSIYNILKNQFDTPLDILIVMIHKYFKIGKDRNNKLKNKRFTKLEFRTYTDQDLLELAKLFDGGGHKYASGATVMDGLDKEELLKTIESYYFASPDNKNIE